jgi:hypothetical protein
MTAQKVGGYDLCHDRFDRGRLALYCIRLRRDAIGEHLPKDHQWTDYRLVRLVQFWHNHSHGERNNNPVNGNNATNGDRVKRVSVLVSVTFDGIPHHHHKTSSRGIVAGIHSWTSSLETLDSTPHQAQSGQHCVP